MFFRSLFEPDLGYLGEDARIVIPDDAFISKVYAHFKMTARHFEDAFRVHAMAFAQLWIVEDYDPKSSVYIAPDGVKMKIVSQDAHYVTIRGFPSTPELNALLRSWEKGDLSKNPLYIEGANYVLHNARIAKLREDVGPKTFSLMARSKKTLAKRLQDALEARSVVGMASGWRFPDGEIITIIDIDHKRGVLMLSDLPLSVKQSFIN